MSAKLSTLDRRRFLRGLGGFALALPVFETFTLGAQAAQPSNKKRFAAFYMPDGVPMPLKKDPFFKDWSWFPANGDRMRRWKRWECDQRRDKHIARPRVKTQFHWGVGCDVGAKINRAA